MAKKPSADLVVCTNRKARFRFEILQKLDCGIVLQGSEVKSLRERSASIEEAYCRLQDGELWLIGAHVAAYVHSHARAHDPHRHRKLLAHRAEIVKLLPKVEQRGLTLVPLKIYFNHRGIAKVTVGLVRGKSVGDKRQSLKKRDHKREMDRAMKRR